MDTIDFILRLLAAAGAGGLVGLEREWSNKSAGLRTNMLVAVGACIFALIGISITMREQNGDPSRIVGQIVTGIGFLGAGVILHKGANVHGLTTAATIWCSAALGCLAAFGLYIETLICTILIVMINLSFKKADNWFEKEKEKNNEKKNDD